MRYCSLLLLLALFFGAALGDAQCKCGCCCADVDKEGASSCANKTNTTVITFNVDSCDVCRWSPSDPQGVCTEELTKADTWCKCGKSERIIYKALCRTGDFDDDLRTFDDDFLPIGGLRGAS